VGKITLTLYFLFFSVAFVTKQRDVERGFDELTVGARPAPASVRNEGRDRVGQ
jgi:hypothetical protein